MSCQRKTQESASQVTGTARASLASAAAQRLPGRADGRARPAEMDIRCETRARMRRSALSAHALADSGARVHARRRKFFGKPSGGREQAAAPAADAGAAAPGAHMGEASALCSMRARKRVCLALMRGCAQADGTAAPPHAEAAPAPKREPAHGGARTLARVCVFAAR
jgi:hypothetical protein